MTKCEFCESCDICEGIIEVNVVQGEGCQMSCGELISNGCNLNWVTGYDLELVTECILV